MLALNFSVRLALYYIYLFICRGLVYLREIRHLDVMYLRILNILSESNDDRVGKTNESEIILSITPENWKRLKSVSPANRNSNSPNDYMYMYLMAHVLNGLRLFSN